MPLDPSIPLKTQVAQIESPFDALSKIAYVQQVRMQGDPRAAAAQEALERAQEKAALKQRQAQIDAALDAAYSGPVDPETGRPTLDRSKLRAHLPGHLQYEVDQQLQEDEKTGLAFATAKLDRRTKQLDLDMKRRAFLGSQLRTIRAAGYDPSLWAIEIRAAQRSGALDDENAERLLGITDPAQIKALTDQYIAAAGGAADVVPVQTLDAQGRPVTRFVQKQEGVEYPNQPAAADVVPVQTLDAQGRPVTRFVQKQPGAEYPNQPPQQSAGDVVAVQTLDAQGRPVTKFVPKVAGAEYVNQPTTGETGGPVKLSPAQQEDISTMLTVQDLGAAALKLGDEIKWAGVGPVAGPAGSFGARWFGTGGEQAEELRNLVGNIQGTIAKLRGGTAFSAQEKAMLESYTPTTKDSELQIKTKIRSLNNFITAKRENMLRVAGGVYTPREPRTTTAPPPASHAQTPYRVGDIVTVKGQKVRVTKLLPNGKYEAVAVP